MDPGPAGPAGIRWSGDFRGLPGGFEASSPIAIPRLADGAELVKAHEETLRFNRNRFSTRLPVGPRYALSHFWMSEGAPGIWTVGLTGFATRMLGEIVEFDFEIDPGETVGLAQCLGWIEGFKATSDIYSVCEGLFRGHNADAARDASVICKDPYGRGWLYRVQGTPDDGSVDVHGYMAHLELTIDRMLERPWKSADLASGSTEATE